MIAANTVTAESAVSSDFDLFFKSLLLSNSCRAGLPVVVPSTTCLRERRVVACRFAQLVPDVPSRDHESEPQNEIHHAVPF